MVKRIKRPTKEQLKQLLLEHRRERQKKLRDKHTLAQQRILASKIDKARSTGIKKFHKQLDELIEPEQPQFKVLNSAIPPRPLATTKTTPYEKFPHGTAEPNH